MSKNRDHDDLEEILGPRPVPERLIEALTHDEKVRYKGEIRVVHDPGWRITRNTANRLAHGNAWLSLWKLKPDRDGCRTETVNPGEVYKLHPLLQLALEAE